MSLVLGIDAAWTAKGSSCVALMRHDQSGRRVVALAPCYEGFLACAENPGAVDWLRPIAGIPDIPRLLTAASKIGGGPVDLVAIDMPMSLKPITHRRCADDKISRVFGAAGAGTHSVNADRPGAFGKTITDAFRAQGFSLITNPAQSIHPALIEVFPLAALVRLMQLDIRPPYKVSKTSRYWKEKTKEQRQVLLKNEWTKIFRALGREIIDLGFPFPTDWSCWSALKPYEDALDAVICAWVGTKCLDGMAEPFGDSTAAIWVPI